MATLPPKIVPTNRTYTDLNLSFQMHPVTGDIAINSGDNAVIGSVRNIIMTEFYERPFTPEVAGGVKGMLFDLITPLMAQNLKNRITNAIENNEPRVSNLNVVVTAFANQDYVQIDLQFLILNNTNPTSITVFLQRAR